jgi:hypothetical protein
MTSKAQKNAGYLLPEQITGHDLICVQLYIPNVPQYRAAFLGQLHELGKWWIWEKSYSGDDKRASEAAQYWRGLIYQTLEIGAACSELPEGNGCVDYPLSSGFISWYPRSPFTDGSDVPEGWSGPPFSFVGPLDILAGYLEGDIGATGFPQPTSGDLTLPSITFNVTGSGVVELHLLTAPNGGMAVVTVDGDLLGSQTFDLNADLVSLPAESNALELVYEVDISEASAHTIEVRFAPVLNDELIPIRYGGGIRSVVLCGFDDMAIDVRQNEETPCILEKTNDGTVWTPFADLSLCPTLPTANKPKYWRVQDGITQWSEDDITFYEFPDGQATEFGQREPSFPGGEDKACIAAKNIVASLRDIFNQIEGALAVGAGVMAIIALITGIMLAIVTAGAAAPLVIVFVAEVMAIGSVGITENLTDEFWESIECEIYTTIGSDGLFSAAEYATFHSSLASYPNAGTILSAITTILGPVGLNNMVTSGGVVSCAHEPCDDTHIREYDFLISPDGWAACYRDFQEQVSTISQGVAFVERNSSWVPQQGWVDHTAKSVSSNAWYAHSRIKLYTSKVLTMTKIEVDIDLKKSTIFPSGHTLGHVIAWRPDGSQLYVQNSMTALNYVNGLNTVVFNFPSSLAVPLGTQWQVKMSHIDQGGFSVAPPYDGYVRIRKIRFFGTE